MILISSEGNLFDSVSLCSVWASLADYVWYLEDLYRQSGYERNVYYKITKGRINLD
jgi:hypothetical protein